MASIGESEMITKSIVDMKKYLIAATVATMMAPAAHALVIDQSQTLSTGLASTDVNETLNFDGYTGTGTVSAVQIFLSGVLSGNVIFTNNGSDVTDIDASATVQFRFSSDNVTFAAPPQFTASDAISDGSLAGGDSLNLVPTGALSFDETITGTDISAYLNPFVIDFQTRSGASFFGQNIGISRDTEASGEVTVNYLVDEDAPTPIPLPAAAWMMLAALGSLFAVRRYSKA